MADGSLVITCFGERGHINPPPPERLAAKLVEIAESFKALQATALAQPGDDAKITGLKAEAQKAIKAGELAKADALLAEVQTERQRIKSEQQRLLDCLSVDEAETSAQRGDIALTRLRYSEAAKHSANAAGVLPAESTYQDQRIGYLQKEAHALYRQGDEFGDNGALLLAIERLRSLLNLMPREPVPLQWAGTQSNLGAALQTLGERETGTARLEEAVAAYRDALKEWTRERVPLGWAATQMNVGNALYSLGAAGRSWAARSRRSDACTRYARDRCQTLSGMTCLEPACGRGHTSVALSDYFAEVHSSDVFHYRFGSVSDFLKTRPVVPYDWVITNPLGSSPDGA